MTWTKLSDDFPDDAADLSDAAFRTHVEGLVWAMRRETSGRLSERDLRRACESVDAARAIRDELVPLGFWERVPGGYVIRHHMEHQPEPDVIAARRAKGAVRQRNWRRKRAGLSRDENADSGDLLTASSNPRPDPTRPDPGNASTNAVSNAVTPSVDDWPDLPARPNGQRP